VHDSYHVRAATVVSSYIIAPPFIYVIFLFVRRNVWRCQRGNHSRT